MRNSFIRTRFTVKSKERKSALFNGQYVTLYWKLKYFVVNIWILITHIINNIFLWIVAICRRYIHNQAHAIWLRCVQIWHFYLTLYRVIVFSWTQCIKRRLQCRWSMVDLWHKGFTEMWQKWRLFLVFVVLKSARTVVCIYQWLLDSAD